MFVLEDAVGVDGKRVGNGFYAEEVSDGSSEAAVAVVEPGHAVFGDELFPLLFVGIKAHAEHNQGLSLKFFRDFANMRRRFAARPAPCRPKVDQDNFSGQIIHGNVLPIQRVDGKGRRHSGPRQFGFRDVAKGTLAFRLADWFQLHIFLEFRFGGGVLPQLREGFAIGGQSFRKICKRCERLGEFVMRTSKEIVLVLVAAFI